jgi:hypothetical protein
MSAVAKVLVPNKVWIVEDGGKKLGTLNKEKKGFSFYRKGQKIDIHTKSEIRDTFGVSVTEEIEKNIKVLKKVDEAHNVYEFPCGSRPHNPVYNIKKKLPIYAKSNKSKSLYCAGYYVIKFRKGWVKSFCPKLITLERYLFKGPFKTEDEMKQMLVLMSKKNELS